jgi:hypothetical protein
MKVTVSVHMSFQNLTRVVPDLHDSHHHHYKAMRETCCSREIVTISLLNPDVTTLSSTMLSFIFLDKANTWANVGKSFMKVTVSNRHIGWRPMLPPRLNLSSMISLKLMIIIHWKTL